ncbi:hypothetical protein LTR10_023242 [Elasticomyces elasticus]|uniref:LisH domain-containing protein n=1 Tax=Exophiala sideris TaxID=1016849 RepID=A0ABR0J3U1_9EURO|nr:hypothetical protein LTR10_023242 [Elasticomyces elasticus]KAK5024734.1 hypothetical protein LTS07_008580 [Exophiala sideris]KAK5030827.1 hypothetical protein LTR13_008181 [Exophiala sideris]KAK5054369.1 hypothetical protein LTR69_008984 [Exophiala sideris]KAK5179769.1 hypothetical protein LTR44_007937 [Eurotiomycetes sp. CCFEE 6388]
MPDLARRHVVSATSPSFTINNPNHIKDLGCFDEDSCRYFLREVGIRVVPFYPFSFGMEEVYSLILERYGYDGIPDATSVLQDLLESEGDASGLGDDGDIWRSWRHSWRHRNDDSLNPFIPKVGNFVLQSPTPPHIRRLKAQNFILKTQTDGAHSQRTPLAPMSVNTNMTRSFASSDIKGNTILEDDSYELPATTYSHQRCRALLASEHGSPSSILERAGRPSIARRSDTTDHSSQQDFAEITEPMLETDIDPSLLLAFEMLSTSSSPTSERMPGLRGGQGDIYRLKQVDTSKLPPQKTEEEHKSVSINSSPENITSHDVQCGPNSHQPSSLTNIHPRDRPERAELAEDSSEPPQNVNSPEQLPEADKQEPSKRRHAINREARLIDGHIITPRARKRLSSQDRPQIDRVGNVDETKPQITRRSWTPVRQNRDSPRHSWLHAIRSIFHSKGGEKSAKSSSHKASTTTTPKDARNSAANSDLSSHHPHTVASSSPFSLGLDGTFDSTEALFSRPFSSRSRLSLNRNKLLTLNSPEIDWFSTATILLPFPRNFALQANLPPLLY